MPKNDNSAEIKLAEAKTLIQAYNNEELEIPVFRNLEGETVKGFRIDAEHIQHLLEGDSPVGTINETADEIFVAFGYDSNEENNKYKTIFFGMRENNLLLDNMIIDYCEPCPDVCPANIGDLFKD